MAKKRGSPPSRSKADPEPASVPKSGHPLLCLRHCRSGWGVEELRPEQCQQFLIKWNKRAKLTWDELVQHDRHGLGSEFIPAAKIKPSPPPDSIKRDRYLVLRHDGNLPFVGFRTGDVFHVLWIEKKYNELYDHS